MQQYNRNQTSMNQMKKLVNGLIIITLLSVVLTAALGYGKRIGDGAEYIAVTLSMMKSGSVHINKTGWEAYENYRQTRPAEFSPRWTVADQEEQHFWFYSLLATGPALVFDKVGLDIGYAFTFVNLFLVLIGIAIAYYCCGSIGGFIGLLLTLSSPILWYLNKVHTEPFTFGLCLGAFALVVRKNYLYAALLFAVASTQNLPFAVFSGLCLLFWFFNDRLADLNSRRVAVVISVVFFVLLQPVYYLIRIGAIHPQLINGSAAGTPSLHRILMWFIDPDVGLFFGWYLAVPVLVIFLFYYLADYKSGIRVFDRQSVALVFLFILICGYAQGKTSNYNHGAVISCSRYALWYLPLFFYPMLYSATKFFNSRENVCSWHAGIIALCLLISLGLYDPDRGESYLTPSFPSRIMTSYAPWLYNPEPEVFVERYSGWGEEPSKKLWAVSTRSGSKVFARRNNIPEGNDGLIIPCLDPIMDKVKIYNAVKKYFADNPDSKIHYFNNVFNADNFFVKHAVAGKIEFGKSLPPYVRLTKGWWGRENWGVWSVGRVGVLEIYWPTKPTQDIPLRIGMILPKTGDACPVASIAVNGHLVKNTKMCDEGQDLELLVPSEYVVTGWNQFEIKSDTVFRPSVFGSNDPRLLGIALKTLEVGTLYSGFVE